MAERDAVWKGVLAILRPPALATYCEGCQIILALGRKKVESCMLFLAAAVLATTQCSPEAVAASAAVTERGSITSAVAGLSEMTEGFSLGTSARQIAWYRRCKPKLIGLRGAILTDASGAEYWLEPTALKVRERPRWPDGPEPTSPAWSSRRFIRSDGLYHGDWRIGLWFRADGRYELARYRVGAADVPISLMISGTPVVDLTYLPAPDAVGGSLSILQRTGKSRYRVLSLSWSEKGLRTPVSRAD